MSNAKNDAKRSNVPARAGLEDIERMPALIDTVQAGSITGETALSVSRACAAGTYPAVKCGRAWRINKAKFLQVVGLA